MGILASIWLQDPACLGVQEVHVKVEQQEVTLGSGDGFDLMWGIRGGYYGKNCGKIVGTAGNGGKKVIP